MIQSGFDGGELGEPVRVAGALDFNAGSKIAVGDAAGKGDDTAKTGGDAAGDPRCQRQSDNNRDERGPTNVSGEQVQSIVRRALPNAVKDEFHHQHLDGEKEEKHSEQLGEDVGGHERQLLATSF